MLLVTGGAGFIGSNVVASLNEAGRADIVVNDTLGKDGKWRNLQKRQLADFVPPAELRQWLAGRKLDAVIHLGAISETTARDGDAVIETNFRLSLALLDRPQALFERLELDDAGCAPVQRIWAGTHRHGRGHDRQRECQRQRGSDADRGHPVDRLGIEVRLRDNAGHDNRHAQRDREGGGTSCEATAEPLSKKHENWNRGQRSRKIEKHEHAARAPANAAARHVVELARWQPRISDQDLDRHDREQKPHTEHLNRQWATHSTPSLWLAGHLCSIAKGSRLSE